MSTLEAILQLLDKWPAWKRITSAPGEIEALRKRVELLEATLLKAQPARDQCPRCNALTWRLAQNKPDPDFGDMGISHDIWNCTSCGFERKTQVR